MRRCVALLAISLMACADDTQPTNTTVVRDSAGVRIVESYAPHWDDVSAWRLDSAPLIDIGGDTGDPNAELYRVVSALRLDDGRIVIANGGSHQLLFYGPSGGYGGAAGGRGDGDSLRRARAPPGYKNVEVGSAQEPLPGSELKSLSNLSGISL